MGHMPPEHHRTDVEDPTAGEVVEFGGDPPPARRSWYPAGLGRSLAADRRMVPLAAVLGAVALLASLVSEWQITTVDAEEFGGAHPVRTDVIDLGTLGTAFLVGLFPLVVAVVLTMFGPPAARRWVRLTGLSIGGTLLGLLFATAASLGDQSRPAPELFTMQFDENQVQFGYGRGLWCAVVGVLLAMLALYLVDRRPRTADAAPTPAEDEPPWVWRRPPAAHPEPAADQPLELTVGPAKPFTLLGDDRDEPDRT